MRMRNERRGRGFMASILGERREAGEVHAIGKKAKVENGKAKIGRKSFPRRDRWMSLAIAEWRGGTPTPMGCKMLRGSELPCRRASVGYKEVSGGRVGLGGKGLVERRMKGEVVIVINIVEFVFVEDAGPEVSWAFGIGGGSGFAGEARRLDQEIAEVGEDAGFAAGDASLDAGESDLGEEASDFFGRGDAIGGGGEFAGEIGGADRASCGVGVGEAESCELVMGGLGAAASIGEGVAAAREGEGVLPIARHEGSIAHDKGIEQ